MTERAVVTGLGVVSPIGIGVESFWRGALEGRCGVQRLQDLGPYPPESYRSRVAGQILDFDPAEHCAGLPFERVDRFAQFSLAASREALDDAQLKVADCAVERVGVIIGSGMGGMVFGERDLQKMYERQKPGRAHPNLIPAITINAASGIIGIAFGCKGVNLAISTACSSSAHALGQAMFLIRHGAADVILAGGADSSLTPLVFGGFNSLRVLSSNFNDQPEQASRPFDQARDGFVMGEGAATLVVESERHARARGARIYAEVAGYAATCESNHMVIPAQDGVDVSRTMEAALADARLVPGDVHYINAHATSTPVGDAVEAKAIRHVFGDHADELWISATKSLFGHTLGAAGSLGAAATVLCLHHGQVHPTRNFESPDEACALPGIVTEARPANLEVGLLNAFGFGSNNATVVLRKPPA